MHVTDGADKLDMACWHDSGLRSFLLCKVGRCLGGSGFYDWSPGLRK